MKLAVALVAFSSSALLAGSTEITVMPALSAAGGADDLVALLDAAHNLSAVSSLAGDANLTALDDAIATTSTTSATTGATTSPSPKTASLEASVDEASFRAYDDASNPRADMVRAHYRAMREGQSVAFVERMLGKFSFDGGAARARMTVREGFEQLGGYVDSSDPDMSLPNVVHNFQTAEGLRAAGHPDWMQLVGLIHDMGKMMFLWGDRADGQNGDADSPQWALGGDTWVVGMPLPGSAVYPEYNELNADMRDARYNGSSGALGKYSPGVGLANVQFAYGHDEYMYRMLVANGARLPRAGLAMVRYHSCYPWHTGGEYRELMAPEDYADLDAVLEFNQFDLYTKDEEGAREVDMDALWPYYQTLIDKYMPGKLRW